MRRLITWLRQYLRRARARARQVSGSASAVERATLAYQSSREYREARA